MRAGDAQIDAMLKGQQWERAKGELRALVAMQGSYVNSHPDNKGEQTLKWETAREIVEGFISRFEHDGLHE